MGKCVDVGDEVTVIVVSSGVVSVCCGRFVVRALIGVERVCGCLYFHVLWSLKICIVGGEILFFVSLSCFV